MRHVAHKMPHGNRMRVSGLWSVVMLVNRESWAREQWSMC